MRRYSLDVNGKKVEAQADPGTPLLWVLRDALNMTGTKYGCGMGVCGACTVHEEGKAVRSCQVSVDRAPGKTYTTIEGLAKGDKLHPCQSAWIEEDVAQCGYCQAGMIMSAADLLKRIPKPSDAQIDEALSDHVCRCGTYSRMRKAVHRAARELAGGAR